MLLNIFVPQPHTALAIQVRPRAAIIGNPAREGAADALAVLIHDNARSSERDDVGTFHDRLVDAAHAYLWNEPGYRRQQAAPSELLAVGTFDTMRWEVADLIMPDLLAAWAEEPIEIIRGETVPPGYYNQNDLPQGLLQGLKFTRQNGYMVRFETSAGQVLDCDTRTGIVAIS